MDAGWPGMAAEQRHAPAPCRVECRAAMAQFPHGSGAECKQHHGYSLKQRKPGISRHSYAHSRRWTANSEMLHCFCLLKCLYALDHWLTETNSILPHLSGLGRSYSDEAQWEASSILQRRRRSNILPHMADARTIEGG